MIQQITVAGQSVNIVVLPTSPGFREVEWSTSDAVAVNRSPFTGVTQTYTWPGADERSGTMTLPKLTTTQAGPWEAALMQCRGMSLPFLMGDPLHQKPLGNLQGSIPLVDNTASNQAGMTTLATKGWTPNKFRLLLPGDLVQVGYRLHTNLDAVNSDANGKAVLNLWPSLREIPIDASALILNKPMGLFRRANNKQAWSSTLGRLTSLSFQIVEWR